MHTKTKVAEQILMGNYVLIEYMYISNVDKLMKNTSKLYLY